MPENNDKLINMLIMHEGLKLHVYDDADGRAEVKKDYTLTGHPTIGVGRNIASDGLGISEKEARYLLANDIKRVVKETSSWDFMEELNDVRKAVIYDMVFNMGITRFNPNVWVNTFNAIKKKDFETAANEMLSSRWAKQVGNRSIRLSDMMRKGEWYDK